MVTALRHCNLQVLYLLELSHYEFYNEILSKAFKNEQGSQYLKFYASKLKLKLTERIHSDLSVSEFLFTFISLIAQALLVIIIILKLTQCKRNENKSRRKNWVIT